MAQSRALARARSVRPKKEAGQPPLIAKVAPAAKNIAAGAPLEKYRISTPMKDNNTVIGKRGMLTATFRNGEEMRIEVRIKDVKQHFGRTEYLVTPIAGSGELWKWSTAVELLN